MLLDFPFCFAIRQKCNLLEAVDPTMRETTLCTEFGIQVGWAQLTWKCSFLLHKIHIWTLMDRYRLFSIVENRGFDLAWDWGRWYRCIQSLISPTQPRLPCEILCMTSQTGSNGTDRLSSAPGWNQIGWKGRVCVLPILQLRFNRHIFSQQQHFATGSLAQNSSGAIRCSFNTRFRARFRRVQKVPVQT